MRNSGKRGGGAADHLGSGSSCRARGGVVPVVGRFGPRFVIVTTVRLAPVHSRANRAAVGEIGERETRGQGQAHHAQDGRAWKAGRSAGNGRAAEV